ncbi:lipoprotein [Spiroplasma phoeniceum]|nr:lipoprotein [Spiroplasma phoeniceum]
MKRLLTIFSAFVLGSGSVFGVVSCRPRIKEDNKNKLGY